MLDDDDTTLPSVMDLGSHYSGSVGTTLKDSMPIDPAATTWGPFMSLPDDGKMIASGAVLPIEQLNFDWSHCPEDGDDDQSIIAAESDISMIDEELSMLSLTDKNANGPKESLDVFVEEATPNGGSSNGLHPSMWCISYQQLMNLSSQASTKFGPDRYYDMTMRDVVREIIEPICAESGTSYALTLNKKGLPIDIFCSHSWDGYFAAFVQSLSNVFQNTDRRPNLWICAFSLVQTSCEEVMAKLIGSKDQPLEEAPFVQALQSASLFCVVRNYNMDVLGRIWCCCELMYARKYGLFPACSIITGPNFFRDQKTSILDAQASIIGDRERVLRVLLNEFNREEIDQFVCQIRTTDTPRGEMDSLWNTTCIASHPRKHERECQHVFCYGNLRPDSTAGLPWTRNVLHGMRAQPATVAGAKLYLDSYPCLVFDDKNDDGTEPNNVKGWVFTADPLVFRAKIRHLNRVHGFQLDGGGLYQRTISTIKLDGPERSVGIPIGAKGDTLDAYIYHRPDCETDLRILSGDWLELPYTAGGEDEGF